MLASKDKNICIVAHSLGSGGAEKASALQSIMLHNLGYSVFVVTVVDNIQYSYKGKLLNLGLWKNKNDTVWGRFNRLMVLRKFLRQNAIDVIIDNRSRTQAYREFIVSKLVYTVPTVYVIHNFNTQKVFTSSHWLNKLIYKKKPMVAVSKAAQLKFRKKYHLNAIRTIYNGFDFRKIESLSNKITNFKLKTFKDYIIFYGRLDDEHKNLKLLIEAYKLSAITNEGIGLLILGSGPDEEYLKSYVKELDLTESIIFKGFEKNPYPFVKQSLFMVLSSRFEGFPMVIPEALGLGVPVVSVDCESGPNEVIKNGYNGLLVENHNPSKLAEAINLLLTNKVLYNTCRSNARESVNQFSIPEISQQWDSLINELN